MVLSLPLRAAVLALLPWLVALASPDMPDLEGIAVSTTPAAPPANSPPAEIIPGPKTGPFLDLAALQSMLQGDAGGGLARTDRLRLLSLVQECRGQHDDAYLTFKTIKGEQQQAWHLLKNLQLAEKLGLEDEARECFSKVLPLYEQRRLEVPVLQLCLAVEGFGRYEPVPQQALSADKRVIIYVEVANPTQRKEKDEHVARFRGSFQVFNGAGISVYVDKEGHEFTTKSRSRLSDFFVRVIWKVAPLKPGPYELVYTVEEDGGRRKASKTQPFTIQ